MVNVDTFSLQMTSLFFQPASPLGIFTLLCCVASILAAIYCAYYQFYNYLSNKSRKCLLLATSCFFGAVGLPILVATELVDSFLVPGSILGVWFANIISTPFYLAVVFEVMWHLQASTNYSDVLIYRLQKISAVVYTVGIIPMCLRYITWIPGDGSLMNTWGSTVFLWFIWVIGMDNTQAISLTRIAYATKRNLDPESTLFHDLKYILLTLVTMVLLDVVSTTLGVLYSILDTSNTSKSLQLLYYSCLTFHFSVSSVFWSLITRYCEKPLTLPTSTGRAGSSGHILKKSSGNTKG